MDDSFKGFTSYGKANYMMLFQKQDQGTYIKFKTIYRTFNKKERTIRRAAESGLAEFQKYYFDHECEPQLCNCRDAIKRFREGLSGSEFKNLDVTCEQFKNGKRTSSDGSFSFHVNGPV